ncbi:MAG: hypothetical protein HY319_24380 [Armatimonadetes bacterium]|nr:hypothetical protein [Armatimonadota bacterium]
MKKLVIIALLALFALPAHAQADRAGLSRIAEQLASLTTNSGLPRNVPLRFAVLSNMLEAKQLDNESIQPLLSFFSNTRQLLWAAAPPGPALQPMAQLEQGMVALAAEHGVVLDLPPVGTTSRAVAVSYTPEAMLDSARQAERMSAEALASLSPDRSGYAELRLLFQALTGVRVALEEGADPGARMDLLRGARARFLLRGHEVALGSQISATMERLVDQLDILVAAHRQLERAAVTR